MELQKFHKKVEIEAIQLTAENAEEVAAWCRGLLVVEKDALDPEKTYVGINVPTGSNNRRASEGDYIVKGAPPYPFSVHKPGIFEHEHDLVGDQSV